MPHVDSEAIERVEYDPASATLFVRFVSGEWYAYLDVEPDLYARMTEAASVGRFFADAVRGRYAYTRLGRFKD